VDQNKLLALEAIEFIAFEVVTLPVRLIANSVESCWPFPTASVRIADYDE
jgi:hypothetical protein